MAHVVTERCVNCRYTDCAAVCPVECFYEINDPPMLVIDPDVCIDCQLCVPECPVHAIYEEDELPDPYKKWAAQNKEAFPAGKVITQKSEPLPGAKTLPVIQAEEKAKGWNINEPRNA
ncbi:MAG: ferredoxin family protein [Phycisphaerae bacterium]